MSPIPNRVGSAECTYITHYIYNINYYIPISLRIYTDLMNGTG